MCGKGELQIVILEETKTLAHLGEKPTGTKKFGFLSLRISKDVKVEVISDFEIQDHFSQNKCAAHGTASFNVYVMYFLTSHRVAGMVQVFIRQSVKGHVTNTEMELQLCTFISL